LVELLGEDSIELCEVGVQDYASMAQTRMRVFGAGVIFI
jgi:hypothetical protein